MTYQPDSTLPREITELVNANGFDILPQLLELIFNIAMQVEREQYLGAARYQRTPERRGHANGFKPKTVQTRVGDIQFAIPQVREGDFYP
ncbi:MAG: transposase, partial [Anaerolineae bacterium]|nr:transposase [Anaerolineae bacterium]